MSTPLMTLDNGNMVHKAAVAGIECKPGSERTDARVIVHLRSGATMLSLHTNHTNAIEERDRLIADWTQ